MSQSTTDQLNWASLAKLAARATIAAGLLAVAAGGCDPRLFDDLADDATVNSSESPDGLDSRLYGLGIASGGERVGDGAAFLVLGRSPDGFGNLRVGADGSVDAVGITAAQAGLDMQINPFEARTAFVGDPGSALVAAGFTEGGPVDGSMPTGTRVHLLDSTNGSDVATFPITGGASISGLAFGATDANGGTQDIAVARGDALTIIANHPAGGASAQQLHCIHDREAAFNVAIADVDAAALNDEVIVALGNASRDGAPSELVVLDAAIVAAASALGDNTPCFEAGVRDPLVRFDAPGGEPDFGDTVLVADFDGNGAPDLAVTAPSASLVYVYLDFTTATDPNSAIQVSGFSASGEFGLPIAAGDLNGGGDELIVGEPTASPDGTNRAGSAHIIELGDANDFGTRHTVHDAQPEDDQIFGQAVGVVPFGADQEILVVGADAEVFTYFATPAAGDADVRQR